DFGPEESVSVAFRCLAYRGEDGAVWFFGECRTELLLQERLATLDELHEVGSHAYLDPLTGVANRRRGDRWLHEATAHAGPHGLGCVMIDLDGFKAINDTFGHPVGDRALQAMARVLIED